MNVVICSDCAIESSLHFIARELEAKAIGRCDACGGRFGDRGFILRWGIQLDTAPEKLAVKVLANMMEEMAK